MSRQIIILSILFSLKASLGYSGPLDKRSTIILEKQSQKVRITALLSKKHLPVIDKNTNQRSQIEDAFNRTLKQDPIFLGGRSCQWGNPSGHVSQSAYYIQALAFCIEKTSSQKITWNLQFLKTFPKDHYILMNLMMDEKIEQKIIKQEDAYLSYHPIPINEAFSEGLSYIGISPEAWSDDYGRLAVPLGLWLLFFYLYLSISENTLSKSRRLVLQYTVFFSSAVLAGFLWRISFSEGLANGLILSSILIYFVGHWLIRIFSLRLVLISFVATIQGFGILALIPGLETYVGTTSLFAAFHLGSLFGILGGIIILLPCMRWINHALPQNRTIGIGIQSTVIIASIVSLFA